MRRGGLSCQIGGNTGAGAGMGAGMGAVMGAGANAGVATTPEPATGPSAAR